MSSSLLSTSFVIVGKPSEYEPFWVFERALSDAARQAPKLARKAKLLVRAIITWEVGEVGQVGDFEIPREGFLVRKEPGSREILTLFNVDIKNRRHCHTREHSSTVQNMNMPRRWARTQSPSRGKEQSEVAVI